MTGALENLKHRGKALHEFHAGSELSLGSVVGNIGAPSDWFFSDNRGTVVFDGLLYEESRVPFAERILQHYLEEGPAFLEKLDGSFAFVAADKIDFLVARDPFGLKPLYYGMENGKILFASELKAVAPFLNEVHIFPPGYYFTPRSGLKKYFDFGATIKKLPILKKGPGEIAESIKQTLEIAVKKRLSVLRENPAVLLSGGLDSSCIAAIAMRTTGSLRTFTVGFGDSDDLLYASQVADRIGAKHFEYHYGLEEMLSLLPEIIYRLESFDAPLVRSAIPNYLAARMVKENEGSTILMGEGADELFAGYDYMKGMNSDTLKTELERILTVGHQSSFQRDDRMSLAFGLEYDVPFMDMDMIKLAFSIPVELKIHGALQIEKWILRKAFESELPRNVVWRDKKKFSIGAGSVDILRKYAEDHIDTADYEKGVREAGDVLIRSKEELMYYRIFRKHFPSETLAGTVGRN